MRKLLPRLVLLFAALPLAAQQSKPFDFSIKNIMRGAELYGRHPDNIHWSADSKWIYFTWLEPGTDWRETPKQFRVRAVPGARPERVSVRCLTPVRARLEPGEVDPPAVGAPVDVVGLSAVQLGPAHDVLDGEVEWPGLLRGERKSGEQQKEA